MLQHLRDADAVNICVLERKQLAAQRSSAEHVNLRSEQEACNRRLKGQLDEQ